MTPCGEDQWEGGQSGGDRAGYPLWLAIRQHSSLCCKCLSHALDHFSGMVVILHCTFGLLWQLSCNGACDEHVMSM